MIIIFRIIFLPIKGLHRYVFLVYKQTEHVNAPKMAALIDRRQWSASKFADAHHLGNPVAGNLYQVCVQ